MKQSKTIRFGVIGTNFITDWIIEAAKDEKRFELTAVYSRTKERADEYAAQYNIPHKFTCLTKMAQSDVIDAIYIASPNALHLSQSLLFMQHGKHVLCEKPLASNAAEGRKMIEYARENKLVLMEAMMPTLTPNFKVIMSNLHRVGKVRQYFAAFCQYSSRYEMHKKGIAVNAFNPELSNASLLDVGIYTIYPMVVLFGKPDEIKAQATMMSTGTDIAGTVNFKYKNGMTATAIYSKVSDSILPAEIQGEAGSLIIERIQNADGVQFIQGGVPTRGKAKSTEPENLSEPRPYDKYYYEIKEFIDLIKNGEIESTINSHENSLIVLEILDEIRRQTGIVFPADTATTIAE